MAPERRASWLRGLLTSAVMFLQLVTCAKGQATTASVTAVYGGAALLDFAPGLTNADFVKSFDPALVPSNPTGGGGSVQFFDRRNFPALVASEISYVMSGKLLFGFVDSGANQTLHLNVLNTGDVTVIPQGLLHFVQEIGNAPAQTTSGFNSENPGAFVIPGTTFRFPPEVVAVSFGQTSVQPVDTFFSNLPSNLAQGSLAPGGLCETVFSTNFLARPPTPPAPPVTPGAGYRKLLSEGRPVEESGGNMFLSANFDPDLLVASNF